MARAKRDQRGWGVTPDVGKSAAEGAAAGEAGNAALHAGLARQSDAKRPGDGTPYVPYTDLPKDRVVDKLEQPPGKKRSPGKL